MTVLELVLVYLCTAVVGVVVFRSLKLPPMLGYLAVGFMVGPAVLHTVQHLAEFGVVFLMFVIGLEFSLPKLRSMRTHVFGLGLAQVAGTMALGTLGLLALRWLMPSVWTLSWQAMVALSGVLAMSSTAIVVKMMAERFELDTDYGKRVMGVLLFQDLAVVPLLILIPALSAPMSDLGGALVLAMLKAAGLIVLMLTLGQRLMRRWLFVVARRKSDELFLLNALLIALSLAWLTEKAGLSLALGAFIAGMLISETPYKHQMEAQIRPFHDLLLGLFFITIGMMLDGRAVVQHWYWVLLLLIVPVLFKGTLIWLLAWRFGASGGVALRTALYLAQAGEFGFVLLNLALHNQLLPEPLFSPILAAMVLSMVATPFVILYSNAIVLRLARNEWMTESLQMTQLARASIGRSEHVIICGYGRSGQSLGRMLAHEKIAYVALDLDPDRVRQAQAAGEPVVYGDAARPSVLAAAGLARASAVVITFQQLPHVLQVLDAVRKVSRTLPVIVRRHDDSHIEELRRAGATEVVPEALEGNLMLGSHALALLGVPMRKVLRIVQEQRAQRYGLLRAYFRSADEEHREDEGAGDRLAALAIGDHSQWAGRALVSLQDELTPLHVEVSSVRRSNGSIVDPAPDLVLLAGDTLVLKGGNVGIADAEDLLSR